MGVLISERGRGRVEDNDIFGNRRAGVAILSRACSPAGVEEDGAQEEAYEGPAERTLEPSPRRSPSPRLRLRPLLQEKLRVSGSNLSYRSCGRTVKG